MKKWICLLAALALSASLLIGKGTQNCRALEVPPTETITTEPTQPEKEITPMGEEPGYHGDDL